MSFTHLPSVAALSFGPPTPDSPDSKRSCIGEAEPPCLLNELPGELLALVCPSLGASQLSAASRELCTAMRALGCREEWLGYFQSRRGGKSVLRAFHAALSSRTAARVAASQLVDRIDQKADPNPALRAFVELLACVRTVSGTVSGPWFYVIVRVDLLLSRRDAGIWEALRQIISDSEQCLSDSILYDCKVRAGDLKEHFSTVSACSTVHSLKVLWSNSGTVSQLRDMKFPALRDLVMDGGSTGNPADALLVGQITKLGMSRMGIGRNVGAAGIAEKLKQNNVLTELDLSNNLIGDDGDVLIADGEIQDDGRMALAKALHTNTTLTKLDLAYNYFGAEGAEALARALNIHPALTDLSLKCNKIGTAGVRALAHALGGAAVATLRRLKKLDIGDNELVADDAEHITEMLGPNTTLTTLYLGSNKFGSNGAEQIATALGTNTTLTCLDMCRNAIRDDGAQHIATALGTNTTLSTLHLGGNQFGPGGAEQIATALRNNTTLTNLNLCANLIRNEGATALCDALNPTLMANSVVSPAPVKNLNLDTNGISAVGLAAVAGVITHSKTLETLSLSGNMLWGGAPQLASALKRPKVVLKELNLRGCNMRDDDAQALAEALEVNAVLERLNVEYNQLTCAGRDYLCAASRRRPALELLF